MKKLSMMALAALLLVSFMVPAWALETKYPGAGSEISGMQSQFGGFWRTRMWMQENFTGEDESEKKDIAAVDTRTRLYYTAIFHENLKFVNKFEFDAVWGDSDLGDISADGKSFEIKNSYADFNMGPVNAKVGIQGGKLARGFLFDDDFSGAVISFNGPGFSIPLIWMKAWEGGPGKDANDYDVDYYGIAPVFNIGDNIKINPFGLYAYSDNASKWTQVGDLSNIEELNLWYAGLDFEAKFNMFSMWATGIYQGGDMTTLGTDKSQDFSAWLAAGGLSLDMNWGGVHGQVFYATGQDSEEKDWEKFWVPRGQSYYWSEIMGYGIFGDLVHGAVSQNSPADQIGNIMAANFGVTVRPADRLKISLDAWYAALAEDIYVLNGAQYEKAGAPANASEENYLGTEIDLVISYELTRGMTLNIVGAYLFAGEATTLDSKDDANPYEVGTCLSLSF